MPLRHLTPTTSATRPLAAPVAAPPNGGIWRRGTRLAGWLSALALASALPAPAHADLYDGLAALKDTLRHWESAPPLARPAPRRAALELLFPGARIDRRGTAARVVLPPLHVGQFGCALRADSTADGWCFGVELDSSGGALVLDGRAVVGVPTDSAWASLPAYLAAALTRLRTLAVPDAPGPQAWPASWTAAVAGKSALPAPPGCPDDGHEVPVHVRLAGRDPADFRYPPAVWWEVARCLAQGCQVYAFLATVTALPAAGTAAALEPATTTPRTTADTDTPVSAAAPAAPEASAAGPLASAPSHAGSAVTDPLTSAAAPAASGTRRPGAPATAALAPSPTAGPPPCPTRVRLEWVVILRPPHARLLHLLLCQEDLTLPPAALPAATTAVRLVPGIRQDNVAALFGADTPRSPPRARVPVTIGRP